MAQDYTGQGQSEFGQGHITVLGEDFSSITQGGWVLANSTSYAMYSALINDTPLQNDQVNFNVWLSVGIYTLSMIGTADTDKGIVTILVDGVSAGTIDWYVGAASHGTIKTLANIVITTAGLHIIGLKMATTNGLSSGYSLFLGSFSLFRTA